VAPAGPPPSAAVELPGTSESSMLASGPGASPPDGAGELEDEQEDDAGSDGGNPAG
jgi:hypothetical protein